MATTDTRLRILDAAERLMADQGITATSLRAVTTEAGVNVAAVHYHFGSKTDLVQAVLARRLKPLNEDRSEALDRAVRDAENGKPTLEEVFEALIRPALARVGPGADGPSVLGRLLGRLHHEQDPELQRLVFEQFEATTSRFVDVLVGVATHLNEAEIRTRFSFLIGAMASTLVNPERLEMISHGRVGATNLDQIVTELVAFVSAGFAAPSAGTLAADPLAAAQGGRS